MGKQKKNEGKNKSKNKSKNKNKRLGELKSILSEVSKSFKSEEDALSKKSKKPEFSPKKNIKKIDFMHYQYEYLESGEKGQKEKVKKETQLTAEFTLPEDKISNEWYKLNKKFNFYDIPSLDEFERCEDKVRVKEAQDLVELYERLNSQKRKLSVKEGVLSRSEAGLKKFFENGLFWDEPEAGRTKLDLQTTRNFKKKIQERGEDKVKLSRDYVDELNEESKALVKLSFILHLMKEEFSGNVAKGKKGKKRKKDEDEEKKKKVRDFLENGVLFDGKRETVSEEKNVISLMGKVKERLKKLKKEIKLERNKIDSVLKEANIKISLDRLTYAEKVCEIEGIKNKIAQTENAINALPLKDKKVVNDFFAIRDYKAAEVVYRAMYSACKIYEEDIRDEDLGDDKEFEDFEGNERWPVYEYANRMFMFFYNKEGMKKTFDNFYKFVEKYHLLPDECDDKTLFGKIFSHVYFPGKERVRIDVEGWRKLASKYGVSAMRFFSLSENIEWELQRAPRTLEELVNAAVKAEYKNADENIEMAHLFLKYPNKYGIPTDEEFFDEVLELNKKLKKRDNIPPIKLNGKDLGYPGYWLVKLPVGDPRASILGKITGCCQSIDGDSRKCVVDGMTRENNGFYVLLRQKSDKQKKKLSKDPIKESEGVIDYDSYEICGECYAWLSAGNNLVFDSWERLPRPHSKDDKAATALLKKASRDFVEDNSLGISRVVVGRSKMADKLEFYEKDKGGKEKNVVGFVDIIKEGYQYKDSLKKQFLIYESALLNKKRGDIKAIMKKHLDKDVKDVFVDKFVTVKQAGMFINFIESLGEKQKKHFGGFFDEHKADLVRLMYSGAINKDDFGSLVSDIENMDGTKLKLLVSNTAISFYGNERMTFGELKKCDIKDIKMLFSVPDSASNNGRMFSELFKLYDKNRGKFNFLISEDAIAAYETGATVSEFSSLYDDDKERLKILLSKEVKVAVNNKWMTYDELKDLDLDVLKKLVESKRLKKGSCPMYHQNASWYASFISKSLGLEKTHLDEKKIIKGNIDGLAEFFLSMFLKEYLLDREKAGKSGFIKYVASQYLSHCEMKNSGIPFVSSKIQFMSDFKKNGFSREGRFFYDIEEALNRYNKFTSEQVDNIENISSFISKIVEEKLSKSNVYLKPYIENLVFSDLIDRCGEDDIKLNLSKIVESAHVKKKLADNYCKAFEKVKKIQNSMSVLKDEKTIDKVLSVACKQERLRLKPE